LPACRPSNVPVAALPVDNARGGEEPQEVAHQQAGLVPSRGVLEIAVAVSGPMTVSRQAARSIMLLAGS